LFTNENTNKQRHFTLFTNENTSKQWHFTLFTNENTSKQRRRKVEKAKAVTKTSGGWLPKFLKAVMV